MAIRSDSFPPPERSHPLIRTLAAALMVGLALAALAAGWLKPRQGPSTPVHTVLGFDASPSFRRDLPSAVRTATGLCGRLTPDTDRLTALRVDDTTEEISDQAVPASPASFQRLLLAHLAPLPSRNGTRPSLFWRAVAAGLAGETAPTGVLFFSNGDSDYGAHSPDAVSAAIMAQAARRLARNPHIVYVAVIGVSPENRAALRRIFAPLGKRFHLMEIRQTTVTPLAGTLAAARRQAHS